MTPSKRPLARRSSALALCAATALVFSTSTSTQAPTKQVVTTPGDGDVLAPFPRPGTPSFSDITLSTGVNFKHADSVDTMAGGVCLFDYDNDGRIDVFVTSRGNQRDELYRNLGNGKFVQVTTGTGLGSAAPSMGAYAADFDNDGWEDLFVIMLNRVRLFRNLGDGTFDNVTVAAGIVNTYWATAATLADYDNDGLVDIYIGNYILDGIFPYFMGAPNKLFHNEGNFVFTDVTATAGVDGFKTYKDPRGPIRSTFACTLSSLFFDYDRDGWMDLLVGNDWGPYVIPDLLYRNNRDGTFTEIGAAAGFNIAEYNMGLAAADINGDLIPDLYTTNLGPNHLLLNDGRGRLSDVTNQWGVAEGWMNGVKVTSWACLFFDMDLDGQRDLYVSNGYINVNAPWLVNEPLAPSRPFQNIGRQKFEVVPPTRFPWDTRVGRGAACGDIDGDGDEDLVQLNNRDLLRFYRNDTETKNNSVGIDLQGTLSNRDGIGAYLVARAKGFTQALDALRGGSYASCNGSSIILGLGQDPRIEELTVRWPSGVTQHLFALDANQRHRIVEPTVTIKALGKPRAAGPGFIEVPVTIENHSASSEPVTFSFHLALGSLRVPGTAYAAPLNLGARAETTASVYLPFDISALPTAQQLGVWLQMNVHSRTSAMDQVETPL